MFKVRGRKVTDLEVFQKIDFMLCLKCTKIVNGVGWDLVKRLQKLRLDGMGWNEESNYMQHDFC